MEQQQQFHSRSEASPLQLMELMLPTAARCIQVAAHYNIADLLGEQTLSVEDLARHSGTNPRALLKVLRMLAQEGIFREVELGVFANSPLSNFLRSNVPGSMYAMARMTDHPSQWASWGGLDYSVATGEPAFDTIYGSDEWTWFETHPEAATYFNQAMSQFSEAVNVPIARAYPDFAKAHVVIACWYSVSN